MRQPRGNADYPNDLRSRYLLGRLAAARRRASPHAAVLHAVTPGSSPALGRLLIVFPRSGAGWPSCTLR